jgi:hypothetical protein
MPFAFRCKNCGHLHSAEYAGECELPHACAVCDAGVTWTSRGIKSFDPSVWEVLADAKPERLKELGLTAKDVCKHVGKSIPANDGRSTSVKANEGTQVADKAGA